VMAATCNRELNRLFHIAAPAVQISSKRRAEKAERFPPLQKLGHTPVCGIIAAIGFRAEPSSLQ
jgi:hypothetical protein